MQLETPVETVQRAAQIARDAGTTVVLNAAPILDLPSAVLEALDILIVNEHEAADLARFAGMDVAAADDADSLQAHRQLASTLTELVPIVVVTIGAAGVVVAQRGVDGSRYVAGRTVTATDTTGAGDTFCGAFVASLDASRTDTDVSPADALERAALFATAAAALSVQRSGAVPSIPNRQEIDDAL